MIQLSLILGYFIALTSQNINVVLSSFLGIFFHGGIKEEVIHILQSLTLRVQKVKKIPSESLAKKWEQFLNPWGRAVQVS